MICRDSSKLPDSLSKLSTITMILFCHIQCQGTGFLCCGVENTPGGLFLLNLVEQESFTAGKRCTEHQNQCTPWEWCQNWTSNDKQDKEKWLFGNKYFKNLKLSWNNSLLVTYLLQQQCQPLVCLILLICQWLIRNRSIFTNWWARGRKFPLSGITSVISGPSGLQGSEQLFRADLWVSKGNTLGILPPRCTLNIWMCLWLDFQLWHIHALLAKPELLSDAMDCAHRGPRTCFWNANKASRKEFLTLFSWI